MLEYHVTEFLIWYHKNKIILYIILMIYSYSLMITNYSVTVGSCPYLHLFIDPYFDCIVLTQNIITVPLYSTHFSKLCGIFLPQLEYLIWKHLPKSLPNWRCNRLIFSPLYTDIFHWYWYLLDFSTKNIIIHLINRHMVLIGNMFTERLPLSPSSYFHFYI